MKLRHWLELFGLILAILVVVVVALHLERTGGRYVVFNAEYPQFTDGKGSARITKVMLLDTATGDTWSYEDSFYTATNGTKLRFSKWYRLVREGSRNPWGDEVASDGTAIPVTKKPPQQATQPPASN